MFTLSPIKVLISLHKGYGLGDAVMVSAVLCHIAKYRPHWAVDFQAEEGKHQVGRGIVANTFAYGEVYPSSYYDAEFRIILHNKFNNYHDRPNTHVSSCLQDTFGIDWDASCGRYQVNVSEEVNMDVRALLRGGSWVGLHYQGNSSVDKKDLSHEQAERVCVAIREMKHGPLVFDFYNKSKVSRTRLTMLRWGGSAEYNCAVISQCKAFIGIDSGPAKCASATDTPSLVVWTGHHLAVFHDPAPNTTHLVPVDYHNLDPVCNSPSVVKFFESHYRIKTYKDDPVDEIKKWLAEVLG